MDRSPDCPFEPFLFHDLRNGLKGSARSSSSFSSKIALSATPAHDVTMSNGGFADGVACRGRQ
jgi:hypothetical protein